MKKHILFLFVICFTSCAVSQSKQFHHYTTVDEAGNKKSYYKVTSVSAEEETRLGQIIARDTGKMTKNGNAVYIPLTLQYRAFKEKIEDITGKNFKNRIFLLEYKYVNDSCTGGSNNWDSETIKNRKRFTTRQKREIEKRNNEVVVLAFFEEGSVLANSPNSKKEYYFKDKDNFLRNSLFPGQVDCGSFALIKPNGETLVRNGESYAWYIEQHLKPNNWELFFPSAE